MAWAYLIIAGMLEWGWPVCLKFAWDGQRFRPGPALGSAAFLLVSGVMLYLAQRTIPMGTAYAVWTGIGAVGAFAIGVMYFDEPATPWRFVGAILIIAGIIALKVGH